LLVNLVEIIPFQQAELTGQVAVVVELLLLERLTTRTLRFC
jgi:hypothetical protein